MARNKDNSDLNKIKKCIRCGFPHEDDTELCEKCKPNVEELNI